MLEVIASAKELKIGAIVPAGPAKLLVVEIATREDLIAWKASQGIGVTFYQRGREVQLAPDFPPDTMPYYYRVLDLA